MSQEWWQTFFTGGMVEFWLRCTTAEQTRQEIDFIQQQLQVSPPARNCDETPAIRDMIRAKSLQLRSKAAVRGRIRRSRR